MLLFFRKYEKASMQENIVIIDAIKEGIVFRFFSFIILIIDFITINHPLLYLSLPIKGNSSRTKGLFCSFLRF